MSAVCIIKSWYTLITIKGPKGGVWIADESAAFQSQYVEFSNRTIESDMNVNENRCVEAP